MVAALFEQAWNIVHIAAHGVFEFEQKTPGGAVRKETGVVLGGGLFLGPSILDQLPVVPAIVFVNCCHLGRIDAAAEAANAAQIGQRPNLAASVAVQLVRMGVRGVLAAGWPVDDVNAGRFAGGFYEAMLGGSRFGEAVLAARQAIYREGGADTTWGAYQCYGEPDWRLVEDGVTVATDGRLLMPSLAEAVAMAEQIREAAQVGLNRDHVGLRADLDALNQARRRNPALDRPELQAALAEAYGELGSLQKAVRYYERAIAAEQGSVSLKAIEQSANLKARLAVRRAPPEAKKEQRDGSVALIRQALDALDKLIALAWPDRRAPQPEGQRLQATGRGRACRSPQGSPGADARLLPGSPGARGEGGRSGLLLAADGDDGRDPRAACRRRRRRRGPPVTLARIAATQRKGTESDDFWAGVAVGDALLLAAIADSEISAKEEEEIVKAYLEPWRRGGSRLKLARSPSSWNSWPRCWQEGPEPTCPRAKR